MENLRSIAAGALLIVAFFNVCKMLWYLWPLTVGDKLKDRPQTADRWAFYDGVKGKINLVTDLVVVLVTITFLAL